MQVDAWEIAVMPRTHHGERCRVSWLQGDLDAMTDTGGEIVDVHEFDLAYAHLYVPEMA